MSKLTIKRTELIGYIAVLITCFISTTHADDFSSCSYTPKKTNQDPYPERSVFEQCASYKEGVLRIAPRHMERLAFNVDGMASFFTSEHYFYVKPDGRFLPVVTFDNGADYFQEGLTRSSVSGRIEFYNKDFELKLSPAYDWAWPFQNGLALVCTGCVLSSMAGEHAQFKGGLWGYINKDGDEVVPVNHQSAKLAAEALASD